MDPWQTILLAFGGNAVLLAVLGWLAKSFVQQLLSKDIEQFKTTLAAESAAATEHLKHELQLVTVEHQIRFSKLHEKRAEVIASLYGLLVEAYWATQGFVSIAEWAGEPSKKEKYTTALNKTAEFYQYFDKNRIYLPEVVCKLLDQFVRNMRKEAIGFGVYVSYEDSQLPDHAVRQKFEAWQKAWEYFENEVPKARSVLENELRRILGAS
jgi:hypothetical protein